MQGSGTLWIVWLLLVLLLAGGLAYAMLGGKREIFLIGATTSGHHQIEMACDSCHTSAFGGREVMQNACMNCHGAELRVANDSHPKSKFTDPRNADRVERLDARFCVTCHREHRPEITRAMGVTLPTDYCFHCHQDIARDRPSHTGLAFDTCASAGCHNFHDNRALYEDFLSKHTNEPPLAAAPAVLWRGPVPSSRPALSVAAHNAPAGMATGPAVGEWASTAHATAGINCGDCHTEAASRAWIVKPGIDTCRSCHEKEAAGFLGGKHGMRLASNLSPMRPELARQPMKTTAHGREITCTACHTAHEFNTGRAAVEGCESCHNDNHSNAYRASTHYRLWQAEIAGDGAPGSGVSCATCHMPRFKDANGQVHAQHNQNDNLRPNEKMLRGVCLDCHGLGFALDALADPAVVAGNFAAPASRHIESLDWVLRRQSARRRASGGG